MRNLPTEILNFFCVEMENRAEPSLTPNRELFIMYHLFCIEQHNNQSLPHLLITEDAKIQRTDHIPVSFSLMCTLVTACSYFINPTLSHSFI